MKFLLFPTSMGLCLIISGCWTPEAQYHLSLKNSKECAAMAIERINSCSFKWKSDICGLENDLKDFGNSELMKPQYRTYRYMCMEAIKLAYANRNYSVDLIVEMHEQNMERQKERLVKMEREDLRSR